MVLLGPLRPLRAALHTFLAPLLLGAPTLAPPACTCLPLDPPGLGMPIPSGRQAGFCGAGCGAEWLVLRGPREPCTEGQLTPPSPRRPFYLSVGSHYWHLPRGVALRLTRVTRQHSLGPWLPEASAQ